jgi:hypothetical protein
VNSRRTLIAAVLALPALPAAARADFYTPPNPLPPGRPGDVIRAQPTTANVLPGHHAPRKPSALARSV